MYTNVVTCVRACDDESDTFPIKIGLHQGSALSLYIFTLVMDKITNDIQGETYNRARKTHMTEMLVWMDE
jgi:hypothetical protein